MALKYDNDKLRYDLIPPECLEALAEIYTAGAAKYGDNNWQNLDNAEQRYTAALFRHLEMYRRGYTYDDEDKCSHIMKVAWNAFALYFHDLERNRNNE